MGASRRHVGQSRQALLSAVGGSRLLVFGGGGFYTGRRRGGGGGIGKDKISREKKVKR